MAFCANMFFSKVINYLTQAIKYFTPYFTI